MKIIGLTGGIACGKSTVSKALRALGAYIVDADAAAHALSQPKQPLFNAYVERFGADIVSPSGTLDRAAIARLIFADPALRAEVDAIAHPLIRAEAERRLGAARAAGAKAAVLDVPLCARNPLMSEREARARIAAQMPLTEKCARADVIIDNSGTKEETQQRVKELWRERIIERA